MRISLKILALLTFGPLGLLTACGDRSSNDGVGGVTASEAEALNQAAEMLDGRPTPSASAPKAPGR